MSDESGRRPYRLKRRAEAQERTRLRIAEAAMELHGSIGPARTSISAVAARADVQRATVYRHFPDEAALFAACSSHWDSLHPAPNPEAWSAVEDPDERLVAALTELYAWYREGQDMLSNILRDEPHVPVLHNHVAALRGYMAWIEELLMAGRGVRGRRRRRVAGAVGHAVDFDAWRSLARRGLGDEEIVGLMTRLVAAASAADRAAG